MKGIYRGLRRAMRVISRPVRRDRGLKGVVIQPYRGYGTPEAVYLMGRVFRQPRFGESLPPGSVFREISDIFRRLSRWGLSDVTVSACVARTERSFTTDSDGYFQVELRPEEPLDPEVGWLRVHLEASRRGETATANGMVYVAPPSARLLVISDIDDTVMHTGVANKAKMLWRLFVQDAESRAAFPGVAALYRGLHDGPGGGERNPMLYVSRAPWSIYEVLETFFRLKEIPEGPVLFLREWGLTLQRPLPRRADDHKRDLIEGMLERYPDLPVLLIGDSGQHDPEVYAGIVRDHPGRIAAVYIRDVSGSQTRADEIGGLAKEMAEAGSPLILGDDSRTMAQHALEAGFLSEAAADAVAKEHDAA
ncbi:MAG: phosphatase domain-containing protein [Gemmatimonadota bacterium]